LQEPLARLREATSLALRVMAVWTVVRVMAVRLLEAVLTGRAHQPATWPVGSSWGRRRRSKGFRERVLQPLFGVIRWRRRVGRCPHGCAGAPGAPVDQALEGWPPQRTGAAVQWRGCLVAVFVP
jgi:hypothetical protein